MIEPVAGAAAAASQPAGDTAGVSVGPVSSSLPQPMSESAVRQQLAESGMTASANQATLTPSGLAIAPIDAPAAVQEVIAAGNEIAKLPYRYGGGHLTYEDPVDCSGSMSRVAVSSASVRAAVRNAGQCSCTSPGSVRIALAARASRPRRPQLVPI